mmetsp:Transcript_75279/g.176687  ORF Transcript_75279/g.176687 Transcript_75279/m.176687 type:complete len:226 (+) Transcript_75279:696-1373(+)
MRAERPPMSKPRNSMQEPGKPWSMRNTSTCAHSPSCCASSVPPSRERSIALRGGPWRQVSGDSDGLLPAATIPCRPCRCTRSLAGSSSFESRRSPTCRSLCLEREAGSSLLKRLSKACDRWVSSGCAQASTWTPRFQGPCHRARASSSGKCQVVSPCTSNSVVSSLACVSASETSTSPISVSSMSIATAFTPVQLSTSASLRSVPSGRATVRLKPGRLDRSRYVW